MGDVLMHGNLLVLVVAEKWIGHIREVQVLWLDEPGENAAYSVTWHHGSETTWSKWDKLCGRD